MQQRSPSKKTKPRLTADSWAPYWVRGLLALGLGMAAYKGGLALLDVHLEWYRGMHGFGLDWVLAMSVLPVATGIVVGVIYGFGGKYLAHFPPALIMSWSYLHTQALPEGVHLLPWAIWIMFVILQMEFCAVGGFIGELLTRRFFSWDNPNFRRADSVPLPDQDEGNPPGHS